ncbi:MAG: prolipoprotein diacylglyceryl transferase [Rhodobacteraceae bacterium]|nr:prolipoprotein diacylglyceryl transferase [Paracoccaceae bacterium]
MPFPDIAPEIFSFELFGLTIALRWYALAFIAGLILGWRYILILIQKPRLWNTVPMDKKQVEDLLTWIVAGVIIGGRLGSVIFYSPAQYIANPIDILKIWEGGMSFHGGFAGVIAGVAIYGWRNKLPILSIGDAVAAAAPFGLFFGRIANYIKPELWGRPTDVAWGVSFPTPRAQTCPPDWVGECLRHPSQLYEAGLEGLVLGLIMAWVIWRKDWLKAPGRVIGLFLLGYGSARWFVEYFRQPDMQFTTPENPIGYIFSFAQTGVTMGQLLSLPMIVIGAYMIIKIRKKA